MSARPRPPGWARVLVALAVPEPYRDDHLGDLEEGFRTRAPSDLAAARRWYAHQALRTLGPALRLRARRFNDDDGKGTMDGIRQDLRYSLRAIRRSPVFALVASGTLALAIGVNSAIFSLVSEIVFADLPMRDAPTMAVVRGVNRELGIDQGSVSVPDYIDLADRATSFEDVAALADGRYVLTGDGEPVRLRGYRITAGLLDMWKLPPVVGRSFLPGEDQPGADPVAIVSYPFWQGRLGGRPDVVGTTLRLDGITHSIVGVMNPAMGFAEFGRAQVWTPLVLDRGSLDREERALFVTGRLAPGVSQERATEELAAIGRALAAEHPETNSGWDLWSAPVMKSLLGDEGKVILLMLVLTVGAVVLIACANVANMLLARASARETELAVRGAMGAGRVRLVRQLLTENLVLSLMAGAAGLGLARLLLAFLVRVSNGQEELFMMAGLDARVVSFTLAVALLAPLVFGGLPALKATLSAAGAFRESRSTGGSRAGRRTRNLLAGAQISLALSLMVVAGLLTRTIINLQTRELGFDPDDLVTLYLDLPEEAHPDGADRVRLFEELRRAVGDVAGVEGVELSGTIPLVDFGAMRGLQIQDRPEPEDRARPLVEVVTVSPGYMGMVGIDVVRGRGLEPSDDAQAPGVTVLSTEVATSYWPGEDPVGRRIRWTEDGPWLEVVGVVGDVATLAEQDERPAQAVYVPYAQNPGPGSYLVVRTAADAATLAGPLRQAVWSVDPEQPIDRLASMKQAQYDAGASGVALVSLFAIFAIFALLMSGIGIYGVMSYGVAQRRAEIGLRIALGAASTSVGGMILGQGLRVVAWGVGVGLPIAWLLSRLLKDAVYGVSTNDPVIFLGVPGILAFTAVVATLVPALRAARAQPVEVLRGE